MRILCAFTLCLGLTSACAQSVRLTVDGSVMADAATTDASAPDASTTVTPGTPTNGVACGPNRCIAGEICCNARCGVCAFPSECRDVGCP